MGKCDEELEEFEKFVGDFACGLRFNHSLRVWEVYCRACLNTVYVFSGRPDWTEVLLAIQNHHERFDCH